MLGVVVDFDAQRAWGLDLPYHLTPVVVPRARGATDITVHRYKGTIGVHYTF